jgi:ribose transport system substrate-binding protein
MLRWRSLGFASVALLISGSVLVSRPAVAAHLSSRDHAGKFLRTPLKCNSAPSPQALLSYRPPKAKKHVTVTLMEVTLAGYYYQTIAYGAQQAAKQAGVTYHLVSAGQGYASPSVQVQQAENVLQKGTNAIVLAPSDIEGSIPVVTKAKAKQIPVINISTIVDSPDVYTVMQDDYIMGKLGADEVHRLLPKGGSGIVIAGPANATWSRNRAYGFQDEVAAKHYNLQVIASPTQNVDPSLGLKSFDNAIIAHPDIKWVYTVFDFLLQPESMPSRYKNVVFVTDGYDPTSAKSLRSGRISSIAGITPYWMGYVGMGEAVSVLNGNRPPKINCIPIPIITRANMNGPVAKHELSPPGYKAG